MSSNRTLTIILAVAGFYFSGSPAAIAEWRCDCTHMKGACSATVTVRDDSIHVSSDEKACSRVDYFIDGQPFVTVVVDGEQRQDWLSRTDNPEVLVQSCQVCEDRLLDGDGASTTSSSASTTATSSAAASNGPMIRIDPVYPADARAEAVEGHVVVEVVVTPSGNVRSARVLESKPSGRFDRAALAAVQRWKYAPLQAPEDVTRSERVEFRMQDVVRPAPASVSAVAARDGNANPRNQCIKQARAFNFGDVVEVQLFNACEDPLLVYACSPGVGAQAGQWACVNREQQPVALIGPDDPRSGRVRTVETNDGQFTYRYADQLNLSRPPNTDYWWIACRIDDLDCHDAGVRWTGYLHMKPASLDPRRGTTVTVAGSY